MVAQGVAAYDAGKYTRKVMRINEHQAEVDGVAMGERIRSNVRQTIGRQIVAQGSSGFVPMEGTALDEIRESAINGELDVLTARREAKMRAIGFRTQGDLAYNQGYSAMTGGILAGAASLAEKAASAGSGGGGGGG